MNKQLFSPLSRRGFLSLSAAAAASTLVPLRSLAQEAGKPNSNFNGVQIGTITYSYRGMPGSAQDILNYVIQSGISSIELMGEPVEEFAGIPQVGRSPRSGQMTEEQRNEIRKQQDAVREWRATVSMEKFEALRGMYNAAGVNIHIVKFGNIGDGNLTDEEIHYYFKVAKALGAKGITRELSEDAAKRLGPIADEHQIWIGFHNHTQLKPDTYDGPMLSHGKYLGINLDIGHYIAGTNESPIPLIQKFHDRIISLHIKDRKIDNGPNMPFGEGDTPVKEALQLLKKEKWPIPADIELEYPVPQDSDPVKEVAKCVQFCKEALA
ncbi:MAG: sugar phosphate isomerase/epimerase [bacterium]|jgi:sugar phosphate isomerase/epimerase|nr:sugar phosphate isomerase/epimerase [bacterium]